MREREIEGGEGRERERERKEEREKGRVREELFTNHIFDVYLKVIVCSRRHVLAILPMVSHFPFLRWIIQIG